MINVPIAVKDALREGTYPKNYHIDVLNDDETIDFSFDNSNIVSESVKIDERLCSEDEIKFGLCEGSSLEFQYFGLPSIQNRRIKVTLEVYYGQDEPYAIPMGYFVVGSVPRQASTGILKVTAYNKLMSKYLDEKANSEIQDIAADGYEDNKVLVDTILTGLLDEYAIKKERNELEYDLTAHNSYPSYTVQLLDREGNFVLHMDTENTSAELTNFAHDTIDIENADKYCKYVKKYLESIHDWIINNIKNGETFWNDTIVKTLLLDIFPVVFESHENEKVCLYIPKEYINTPTVSWFNRTYYLRPLEKVYKIVNPKYWSSEFFQSFWLRLYSNIRVKDTNDNVVKTWTFEEQEQFNANLPKFFEVNESISTIGNIELLVNDLSDVTLRELQSSVYETECKFGQLNRITDLFYGAELNQSKLLPQETLYPSNGLHPSGASLSASKSMYSQLWANENNVHKWRYLIITYKGLDENQNEVEKVLQRTIDEHGTENYNCSDNWLFRNLVWTDEQIGQYADAMVAKMQDITWFPFEMWCAGLPYLETGDQIEIPLDETTYTSYVLQRTLNGIQNLQDTYINGQLDIF